MAGLAQTNKPNVAEILNKLSLVYQAASQYELIADIAQVNPDTGDREASHMLVALKAPDRYRVERTLFEIDATGDKPKLNVAKKIDIILDGTAVWFYDPKANQYASYPAAMIGKDLPDEIGAEALDYSTMFRFRAAADFAGAASFLREEDLDFDETKVACYVVSVKEGDPQYTWWIDPRNSHVLKEEIDGGISVFQTVKLGEPLPDSLFKFEAPPGAQQNQGDQH